MDHGAAWMRAVRNYRGVGVAEALAGAQLTDAVCKYMWKLFLKCASGRVC